MKGLTKFFAIIPGVLMVFAAVALLALLVIKVIWSWVVPDLFPGAVSTGLIVGHLSWYMALKLAIFVAFLGGISRQSKSDSN